MKIFNDIKNNSWDAVILTHDQFGKIPQSPEMQQEIFQAELDSVEENLNVLRSQGKDISKMMLRGLEKRKANLEVKLSNLAEQIKDRTDDVVDFKMMGIDLSLIHISFHIFYYQSILYVFPESMLYMDHITCKLQYSLPGLYFLVVFCPE